MNNTKNILLLAIIAATVVMGTSVIPMQSYADRDNNDDHKNTKESKSSKKLRAPMHPKKAQASNRTRTTSATGRRL